MKLGFSGQLLWVRAVDVGHQGSSPLLLAISGQRIPISLCVRAVGVGHQESSPVLLAISGQRIPISLWVRAVGVGHQESSPLLLAISGHRIPISYSHYLQITYNFISTSFPWSFSVPFSLHLAGTICFTIFSSFIFFSMFLLTSYSTLVTV